MPAARALVPLLAFGSLGLVFIAVSSLIPAGPAPAAESLRTPPLSLPDIAHAQLQDLKRCLLEEPDCRLAPPLEVSSITDVDIGAAPEPPAAETSWLASAATVASIDPGRGFSDAVFEVELERADGTEGPLLPGGDWARHTLNPGEHLAALWNAAWGLRLRTLYRLVADPDNARLLNVVHPGQLLEWQIDLDGELKRLRLWTDRGSGHEWVRLDGTDEYTRVEIGSERTTTHRLLAGEVSGALADSLATTGSLSPLASGALASLLASHLPLGEPIHDGDRYTLLVEIETLAGDDTPYDIRLLAFAFSGVAIGVSAARHSDGRFYTPEGLPLLPVFDRHPFHGEYRITSGYTSGRRHPITGRVAPHNGTDFSMPIGTPIVTPADGRVAQVEHHRYAGTFVVIDHGQGYTTRYLHLQRALAEPGQTVKRGERIALSGNSGRTTSAHLHYELHVNGRAVDPMRAELPRGEPLSGMELAEFQRTAQPLLAELQDAAASRQVAMRVIPDPER